MWSHVTTKAGGWASGIVAQQNALSARTRVGLEFPSLPFNRIDLCGDDVRAFLVQDKAEPDNQLRPFVPGRGRVGFEVVAQELTRLLIPRVLVAVDLDREHRIYPRAGDDQLP